MVKGVVRNIDNLGRLAIPKEFRKSLQIGDMDFVDIYLNGSTICIDRVNAICVCCGASESDVKLQEYKGVLMCPNCHPDTVGGKSNGKHVF